MAPKGEPRSAEDLWRTRPGWDDADIFQRQAAALAADARNPRAKSALSSDLIRSKSGSSCNFTPCAARAPANLATFSFPCRRRRMRRRLGSWGRRCAFDGERSGLDEPPWPSAARVPASLASDASTSKARTAAGLDMPSPGTRARRYLAFPRGPRHSRRGTLGPRGLWRAPAAGIHGPAGPTSRPDTWFSRRSHNLQNRRRRRLDQPKRYSARP